MRITRKYLDELLKDIATLEGKAVSKDEAIKKGLTHYYYLEHNSIYGGYRVVSVSVDRGSHSGAFGGNGCEARMKGKEMAIKLEGILYTLEYNLKKEVKPNPNQNYYIGELLKVNPKLTEYAPTIKIFANGNGEDTKHLNLNKDSAEVLINWLTENFVK